MISLIREDETCFYLTIEADRVISDFDTIVRPFVKKYLDAGYKAAELEYVISKHIYSIFAGEVLHKRIRDMRKPKKKVIIVPVELDIAGVGMPENWCVVRDVDDKEVLGFMMIHDDGPVSMGPDRKPCEPFEIEVVDIGD